MPPFLLFAGKKVAQILGFAAFKKAGKFYFLQSSQNIRERGNQLFRRVVFPSPLDPHPFLAATRGVPLDPYATPQDVSAHFRSVDMTAFAVFATLICQINSVFPCKDTKAAKSVAFCDSLPVFL